MNQLKLIFATLITVLAMSCNGQDYCIQDSTTQKVNAQGIKHVIVECYCKSGVEFKQSTDDIVVINVKATKESVGYHGEQDKPQEIGKDMLSFDTEVNGDTLKLISKEWSLIHHTYLIDDLLIFVPKGVDYQVVNIPREELEGRSLK